MYVEMKNIYKKYGDFLASISFTRFPSIYMSPEFGVSSPAIIRRSVVLPLPDGCMGKAGRR